VFDSGVPWVLRSACAPHRCVPLWGMYCYNSSDFGWKRQKSPVFLTSVQLRLASRLTFVFCPQGLWFRVPFSLNQLLFVSRELSDNNQVVSGALPPLQDIRKPFCRAPTYLLLKKSSLFLRLIVFAHPGWTPLL